MSITQTPFRRLLAGLDTVQAAYYLRPEAGASFSFEPLLLEKERLRAGKSRDGTPVELGDWSLLLKPYGSGSGYPLVLENGQLTIECGEFNNPSFFVTFRSEALWHQGARALHEGFLAWAASVGLVPYKGESLSRVDFTFDYHLPAVEFDDDNLVSLSAKDSRIRENGRLQTLQFGRGDVVLRIYDKVAEIEQQSGKVWLFALWGESANVWRIEWQVRKDVLRRFAIRSFEDLFAGQGDVLRYLAGEHDSLRVRTDDTNRSRWPVHPLWDDLLAQIGTFEAQGVYREIDPQAALEERLRRIAVAVYGYTKRVGAIVAAQNGQPHVPFPFAFLRLRDLVQEMHHPLSWRIDVEAKCEQMRLGQW